MIATSDPVACRETSTSCSRGPLWKNRPNTVREHCFARANSLSPAATAASSVSSAKKLGEFALAHKESSERSSLSSVPRTWWGPKLTELGARNHTLRNHLRPVSEPWPTALHPQQRMNSTIWSQKDNRRQHRTPTPNAPPPPPPQNGLNRSSVHFLDEEGDWLKWGFCAVFPYFFPESWPPQKAKFSKSFRSSTGITSFIRNHPLIQLLLPQMN